MPSSLSAEKKELVALSWHLIEWKVAYYKPEAIHSSRYGDYDISDEDYDAAEVRYLTLCRELGHENTIVHKGWPGFEDIGTKDAMVEVDETRPSVQLVMAKLSSPKARKRTKRKK